MDTRLAKLADGLIDLVFEGGSLDGADAQEMLIEAHILQPEEIDSEHFPCHELCACADAGADPGDTCYRLTQFGKQVRDAAGDEQLPF